MANKKNTTKRVVKVEKEIIHNGRKLSLLPAKQMPISKEQILTMLQRTPANHIFTKPGKGGGTFEFVTGVYIKKVLNYAFGFNWDFEITGEEEKHDQIIVQGKLTVRNGKGGEVSKMQYGRADIKYRKGTKTPVDYGNDKKAATTDCLKKCASEFGIASDVYGKNEFKDLGAEVEEKQEKPKVAKVTETSTVNYKDKLKQQAVKMGFKGKTQAELLEFINKKLGSKIARITNQRQAQVLLGEILQAK